MRIERDQGAEPVDVVVDLDAYVAVVIVGAVDSYATLVVSARHPAPSWIGATTISTPYAPRSTKTVDDKGGVLVHGAVADHAGSTATSTSTSASPNAPKPN